MKLSIIIVNYNVKYFLLQLLGSIFQSRTSFPYEVIIVDNASSDGSAQLIAQRYPDLVYIENSVNVGFSKANNQGIDIAKGSYILLLNPDTIVQEDTLEECVSFMDAHLEAGALGCRMIDGSGHFLPESKRGFPSPKVAFFKAFGLSSLFPRSKFFNTYYLGHLPEHDTNEIDVLTGAFMMIRRSVINDIGNLDERFFMYGEDIDLSYRIVQGGYKIYYHPATTIIHFKGESTKKDTLQYIRTFYGAMKGFARKHYSGQKASILGLTLNIAIYFRAGLAAIRTVLGRFGLPVIEFVCISISLWIFTQLWALIYYHDINYYQSALLTVNISIFSAIYILCIYLMGAYDRLYSWLRLLRGIIAGWILTAAFYGLLSATMRPSRVLVIAAGFLALATVMMVRVLVFRLRKGNWKIFAEPQNRYIIVGDHNEGSKVTELVQLNHPRYQFQGYVSSIQGSLGSQIIGHISQLDQICRFYNVEEIIFLSKYVDSTEIMRWMTRLGQQYRYKMAPDRSTSIIGSRSKDLPGELYTMDIHYNIDDTFLKRNKRLLDIAVVFMLFILSPFAIWWINNRSGFFLNAISVVRGRNSWVSYSGSNRELSFPSLRPGVLTPLSIKADVTVTESMMHDADFYYARDYTPWKDVIIIFSKFSKLGNR
ncbi:MAG: glycosyltransferase [Saprospiraceae bacterium]|nr:glycosyltransferase [Saprospiraceae bacterium]